MKYKNTDCYYDGQILEMVENFTTDEEGYGCYKGYRIGMIEKLPDEFTMGNAELSLKLYVKIQELIDKVNALEDAVKQCDRPVELDI